MSAGFTPGPWEVSLEAARFVIQHTPVHGMGKRALAVTAGSEPANPFNAHLIAAAPDLFEALDTIADVWSLPAVPMPEGRKWHCQHEEALHSAVLVARAALAKARGEAK